MNREVHVLLAAILLAANALCLAPTTSIAAVIPLTDASVIGGNHSIEGEWDTGGANGDFAGGNITDGDRSEDSPDSMWLANGENETNEEVYLVIDLGDSYNIGQIDLYNTHNRTGNNYATDSFRIEASNSVVNLGSPDDFDLSGTVSTILTGNMSTTTGEDPVTTVDTFTSFTAHPEVTVQYLKFVSITGMHNIPSEAYHNDRRGLNEIEVFTQPPYSRKLLNSRGPRAISAIGLILTTGVSPAVFRRLLTAPTARPTPPSLEVAFPVRPPCQPRPRSA